MGLETEVQHVKRHSAATGPLRMQPPRPIRPRPLQVLSKTRLLIGPPPQPKPAAPAQMRRPLPLHKPLLHPLPRAIMTVPPPP